MSIKQMAIYSLLIGMMSFSAHAQTQSSMQSSTVPSGTIPSTIPPLSKPLPQQGNQNQPPPGQLPARRVPAQPVPQAATYFHPGIIVFQGGGWTGTDQLLNLSHFIGVFVEEVKAPNVSLGIGPDDIKKRVEDIFMHGGITPMTMALPTAPPLPAFHIRLFIYPVGKGYAIFCDARLLESVEIARFNFDPNTAFQAITWQRESLILAPAATAVTQLEQLIDEIANSFVSVFRNYEQKRRDFTK